MTAAVVLLDRRQVAILVWGLQVFEAEYQGVIGMAEAREIRELRDSLEAIDFPTEAELAAARASGADEPAGPSETTPGR